MYAPPSFSHSSHRYAGGAAGIGRETALQYARSKCVFAFESQSFLVDECAEHQLVPQSETRARRPQRAWAGKGRITDKNGGRVCLAVLFTVRGSLECFQIRREAIGLRCDVTVWDDQLKLFEAAIEAYHAVDIVVSPRSPLWSGCS